ncbi:MAG: ROK family protein, partial [Phycicoccus sp.]
PHNLGVVLRTVVDAATPPSRAAVALSTGLTRATASRLVDRLLDLRLLEELETVPTRRAGRPAVPLAPARGTWTAIGVEVGATHLGVRVVDLAHDVHHEQVHREDLRGSDPTEVLDRVALLAADAVAAVTGPAGGEGGSRVVGAALALPGLVDQRARALRAAPNLGWRNVPLAPLFETRALSGLPILLCGNEAQLAARAELAAGPPLDAESTPSFVLLSGDVGIGGALVVDGRVLAHGRGWAGEVGHTTIDPDGPPCACGARGCLEAYAGRRVVMTGAGLDVLQPVASLLARLDAGDRAAHDAVGRAGHALGLAAAQVANVVDLEEVRLGGFHAELTGHLAAPVLDQLDTHVLAAPWSRHRVTAAAAGPGAALTGAALAVLDRLLADPLAFSAR